MDTLNLSSWVLSDILSRLKLMTVALLLGISSFVGAGKSEATRTFPALTQDRDAKATIPALTIERDLKYAETTDYSGQKVRLALNVYRSKSNPRGLKPAILWVHGGGLTSGNKDGYGLEGHYAEVFAHKGFVTVNIDYRLRRNPDADFNGAMKDAMTDVLSALNWLRASAAKYGIDVHKIVLAGYSAGAEIVTNLTYSSFIPQMDRSHVAGVIDIAGNTLFWGDASPASPPCLIVHGTADTINPITASQNLKARLLAKGIRCRLFSVEGDGHSLDGAGHWDTIEGVIEHFLGAVVSSR